MAAFEKICSGITGLDHALDHIRMGDNVVWRVTELEEFAFVVKPFARQAIADGRQLIYIRFAEHAPFLEPQEGLQIYQLHPQEGFEEFTVKVREIITRAGRDAFYVFDCLSELQEAWSTDLMMGNFFCVTCPYLFILDTVAYFPVKRGMHSFDALNRIRQTTQLLLDVYRSSDAFYIQPLKVWNRYCGTMFQPHQYEPDSEEFQPLLDGLSLSRFYAAVDEKESEEDQNLDHWDRYFSLIKLKFAHGELERQEYRKICSIMMTRNGEMARLIEEHFSPRDYFLVRNRMIGTGMIGGKACGMLLARKMVHRHLPELAGKLEPHDSYYVGSDVFYTYIVANDCWKLRVEQRKERDEFQVSAEFGKRLREGEFPANIREQFRRMLDYFGQSPIIVRSSSLLEDGFGNAFAGKYESVFCVNAGEMEDRLEKFEEAVKTVYASTMDPSALEYRRNRNLLECDEQMALLVQRVSGSRYDSFLMPAAAGVGYSYNAYKWLRDMDPEAGMLRLVLGLGTRAVDRTTGDYPRIVSLDRPHAQLWPTVAARHRYSQHQVDVLDMEKNELCTIPLEQAIAQAPVWQKRMLLSHDTEAEERLWQQGNRREVLFGDCQGLVDKAEFLDMMRRILAMLQEQYQYPVDIEFAINVAQDGNFVVNLLQCRPLQVDSEKSVEMPEKKEGRVLFELTDTAMGQSRKEKVDLVVLVDPQKYYDFPYARKYEPVNIIGKINQRYGGQGKNMMLIVPGRIGTSSPELGIPVVYADISRFRAVCEVSYSAAGYMPELSYGSHMFQDLVEAHIFYGAIFEDERTKEYHPQMLASYKMEEYLDGMIEVYDVSETGTILYFDMMKGRALCQTEMEDGFHL
ncbi:PEP/pyruvate-binding domain-containing protein [Hespellia stercorisuis]|uniref:Phosphoenolpyruvate synthase n=1 Tax=Hespellia stercorisuis DSM 15480 TaxID=1121950 RepID=A0A1M6UE51_9FIRM|nr:PEP/pyruvate-binding domain-containing protein [Hespellia stercorisuis]SHK67515.1 Pyruvate phosphate dikinase, PEP/pyruvate binding domain [Hespellia stercorisuis DSM 15480]